MKKWVIGGVLLGAAGVGTYFAYRPGDPAPPVGSTENRPAAVTAALTPVAPVVLAKVVDVTDIDPLLDPPAIPVSEPAAPTGPALTAVGYEEPKPAAARPNSAVIPIPLAVDGEVPALEVAPMPREAHP